MRAQGDFVDYAALPQIVIGVCGGDGIGPTITHEAERVLRFLLKDEVERGKVAFKEIDGLTIENRAAHMKAIPDDVLAELKACHVILKGPTTCLLYTSCRPRPFQVPRACPSPGSSPRCNQRKSAF